MPEITYDGKKVTVAPGTNLVEAGLQADVPVPVFCYQKDLGAVGSCRVCAVTVTSQGKSRLVMACMTEAADGMEVTTLDHESVALRKSVLEWLMENHPHDCPICDEGGECQLQDLTIAAGHSIRRYHAPKRTFENQYLGEFISHEMNRCITCYRCSRFYQEYAGGRDFGPSGSRDRVYFGRFEEGPFESAFSGNLVELCPTGVFTDKLFRYKSRVWDLEIAPSVCPHCSVGCNVHPGARHRALQRVRVRQNDAVNGVFLCDRGQFGHGYVMDPSRPKWVRVRGDEMEWDSALGLVGAGLTAIARDHGAGAVACIASPRAALETHAVLQSLASGPHEGAKLAHFDDAAREARALAALKILATAGAQPLDQGDLASCDVLVVAGTSLVDEAPLAALAARQVARNGGKVIVLNAGESYLADVADHRAVHPAKLAAALQALAADATLAAAQRPGILIGSDLVDGPAFAAAGALAKALGPKARLGALFPGPNGFGAAAITRGAQLPAILADLEAGKLKALVLAECDLDGWSATAREALAKLELLVVLDHVASPHADAAHALLPTSATYESEGIFVNRAGRAQAFAAARPPGLDVIGQIDDARFPRTPRLAPPDSQARPAWWVLERLRERSSGSPTARPLAEIRSALKRSHALWQPLFDLVPRSAGHVLDPAGWTGEAPAVPAFTNGALGVFHTDRTLGTEPLSRRSTPMQKMAGEPVALVSAEDAQRLGVNGHVTIESGGRKLVLAAKALATVPAGVVLVPRDVAGTNGLEQGAAAKLTPAAMAMEVAR